MIESSSAPLRLGMRDPNGHDLGTLSLTWDRDRYVIRGDGQPVRHAIARAQLQSTAAWITSNARRLMHEAREALEIGAFAVHDARQHELQGVLRLLRADDGVPVAYLLVDVVDDATLEVVFEDNAIVITTATDPGVIAEHYAHSGDLVGVMIPVSTSATDLGRLATRHAALPHGECLLERIAEHPAADAAVLEAVFALAPDAASVANTIVMRDAAPEALLAAIEAAHPSAGVRDHITMARLGRELAIADPDTFDAIVQRLADHETLSYGVRYRVATHPRTPVALLQRIATFQDATGDVARARLASP